jgi:hypothetical protein
VLPVCEVVQGVCSLRACPLASNLWLQDASASIYVSIHSKYTLSLSHEITEDGRCLLPIPLSLAFPTESELVHWCSALKGVRNPARERMLDYGSSEQR